MAQEGGGGDVVETNVVIGTGGIQGIAARVGDGVEPDAVFHAREVDGIAVGAGIGTVHDGAAQNEVAMGRGTESDAATGGVMDGAVGDDVAGTGDVNALITG